MNKKRVIISMSFAITVLLALLLQSVHSYHHLEKFISEKHCKHHYAVNKTEVSHSHFELEHCFACEFTFSNSLKNELITFEIFQFQNSSILLISSYKIITTSFCGSLFSLRAPPSSFIS